MPTALCIQARIGQPQTFDRTPMQPMLVRIDQGVM
jgi:hypothetical protein